MRCVTWCLSMLVVAACVDPIKGTTAPEETPPDWIELVLKAQFNVDYHGGFDGLALMESQGQHHLVWANQEARKLEYAGCPGNCERQPSWLSGAFDTSQAATDSRASADATMDSSGWIHMIYGRHIYATCPGHCDVSTSWTRTQLDTALLNGSRVAVSPNGQPHIVSVLSGRLRYATCLASCANAAAWQRVSVGPPVGSAVLLQVNQTALAVDPNGRVHLLYMARIANQLVLEYGTCATACGDSLSWAFIAMGPPFTFNWVTSAIAATNSFVAIAYADYSTGDVTYATCSSSSCADTAAWQKRLLGNLVGAQSTALASKAGVHVVAVGGPGISVWRCDTACGTGAAWPLTRLDTTRTSELVAAVVDEFGDPVIARYGGGTVRYYTRNR